MIKNQIMKIALFFFFMLMSCSTLFAYEVKVTRLTDEKFDPLPKEINICLIYSDVYKIISSTCKQIATITLAFDPHEIGLDIDAIGILAKKEAARLGADGITYISGTMHKNNAIASTTYRCIRIQRGEPKENIRLTLRALHKITVFWDKLHKAVGDYQLHPLGEGSMSTPDETLSLIGVKREKILKENKEITVFHDIETKKQLDEEEINKRWSYAYYIKVVSVYKENIDSYKSEYDKIIQILEIYNTSRVFEIYFLKPDQLGSLKKGERSVDLILWIEITNNAESRLNFYQYCLSGIHKKPMANEEIKRNKWLLELNPNDAVAHYNLGMLYDEKDMLDESLAAYKRASELNPSMVEALVGQGNILNKKGKSDEAIDLFKKVIDSNPHYAEAYEGLGLVHVHKKQEEDAIKSFKRAIDINPGLVNSRYHLGILYAKKAQFNEAVAEWTKAIEINPQKTEIHYKLGIAYTKLKKLDDAISIWQKALTVRPDMADFHYVIGLVYKEKGDFEKAEASLKKTLEVNPDMAEVHKVLEELYRSKNMLGDADREAELYKSLSSPHH